VNIIAQGIQIEAHWEQHSPQPNVGHFIVMHICMFKNDSDNGLSTTATSIENLKDNGTACV
jgi:hypothetical protein